MKQVIFRREARAEALEAYRWYEQQEARYVETIVVVAVMHTRRHPKRWRQR